MSEEPDVRRSTRAPRPSTRYDPTHWETGSLASQETTKSAASIRRRRHLREELESSLREEQLIANQEQLIAARLEAHRRTTAIRRALREEENNASCSPRRPSTAATNLNHQPRPQQQQPAPLPASRTLDSASVHSNIRPDSDTPVLKHNESSKLTTQQRYVSPPPTQVIHLPSENHLQHPSTCTDSETTNRGYNAVDQAASAKKAATVKQHTTHATSYKVYVFALEASLLRTYRTMANKPHDRVALRTRPTKLAVDKQLFAYSSSSPTGCFTDPNFDHVRDDDHTLRGSASSISLIQLTTDSWQQQSNHHAVDPRLHSTAFHDDGPKQQHRLRFVFHANIASART